MSHYKVTFISKPVTEYNPAYGCTYRITLDGVISINITDDCIIRLFGFQCKPDQLVGKELSQSEVESLI